MTREEKIKIAEKSCGMIGFGNCNKCPAIDVTAEDVECDFCEMEESVIDEYLKAFGVILPDAVHPNHYKLPNGMQVVDVEVAMLGKEAVQEHCLCTAVEYILRHKGKNGAEDIRKAHWWLSKWVELEGAHEEATTT